MTVLLSPLFNNDGSQIDSSGDPRSGGLIHTYLAGTTTPATTYKESTGVTAHTNPIVLNSNGLPPAPIWLTTGSTYKFVLSNAGDTTPPAAAILTVDNVSAVNDTAAAATSTEWTASGMTATYISATSFSVAGDQTTVLHVSRRLKLVNTAGTYYGHIINSVYTSLTTVKVLLDSAAWALDSGLTGSGTVSYGISSADNTSVPFVSRDQQCGRLVYVSTTQIRLDPQDGNTIWVYSGSQWRRRTIPSAGITAANTNTYVNGTSGQTLSTAGATYYVYLFDLAGVLTMDFSTTAPAVDATSGLKIKTGDPTRLLIGMVRVQSGSSQFVASPLVLSWYKRRGITVSAALTTARTTTSTSPVELNAEIQVKFTSWAEEAVLAQFTGYASNNTGGQSVTTNITLDGATNVSGVSVSSTPTANYADNVSVGGQATVTEGYHYMTITVNVSANTGSWSAGTLFVLTRG